MRKYVLLFAFVGFAFVAATAQEKAENDSIKPKTFWTTVDGEVELGYADYKGNTDKIDLSAGFKLKKTWEKNVLAISASTLYGEASGVRNQENYKVSLFDEVKFTKIVGGYLKYGFVKDEFAGYDALHQLGMGVLFTAVDNKKVSFKSRLGYEYRGEEFTDGNSQDAQTGKAGFRFKWLVMERVKFFLEVNYQYDFKNDENYYADGFATLNFDVNKLIDIAMKYSLNYRNLPPAETENLDRVFLTTLKLKF